MSEQQQTQYVTTLRDRGLGGKFSSDSQAGAHAQAVCRDLDNGGEAEGPQVDYIVVQVYCPDYQTGFDVLEPIHVTGSFLLVDTDPSIYFPSVVNTATGCEGRNGYSDIGAGTTVTVQSNSGKVLDTTHLQTGHGGRVICKFNFRFTVMEGVNGGYYVEVANRGRIHFTESELKIPGRVRVTLGL